MFFSVFCLLMEGLGVGSRSVQITTRYRSGSGRAQNLRPVPEHWKKTRKAGENIKNVLRDSRKETEECQIYKGKEKLTICPDTELQENETIGVKRKETRMNCKKER